jgi:hypothetical protein
MTDSTLTKTTDELMSTTASIAKEEARPKEYQFEAERTTRDFVMIGGRIVSVTHPWGDMRDCEPDPGIEQAVAHELQQYDPRASGHGWYSVTGMFTPDPKI